MTPALNNLLQARNRLYDVSWVESVSGPRNAPTWTIQFKFAGAVIGVGTGITKRLAKEDAIRQAYTSLQSTG
ncbi:uncharacterized protein EV420DRAFT_1498271 [Desarmillaria tabescens]|uniref:DRBM domain-containing protein n=1 Tax=Armillaria tabescens TaxID=1929756 RepID=A0AA39NQN4_ARMTA|nr:uncharacterized protein EV420DRAFT_1498271 [Desarmillaria tabescens]KAK0470079.1 hypothetical protein EV420DRAFT_1498271 [Desarmillaria tabescens]